MKLVGHKVADSWESEGKRTVLSLVLTSLSTPPTHHHHHHTTAVIHSHLRPALLILLLCPHPLTHLQLSPSYWHQPLTLNSPDQMAHKAFKTFSHSASTTPPPPPPLRSRTFLHVFINTLAYMHCKGCGCFVRGCCPSPSCDWQVRAAVHASDGFTWGVCAQRGRQRGTYTRVCFSQLHCCRSPWFPLSVSSLGRHPSTGAFPTSANAAGCEAVMKRARKKTRLQKISPNQVSACWLLPTFALSSHFVSIFRSPFPETWRLTDASCV